MSELAALIRKRARNAPAAKPQLRVVRVELQDPPAPTFDNVTRDAYLRRIRYLARAYRLGWLVDQETFHVAGLDTLENADLSKLLEKMERARECPQFDVSYEDADLVRACGDDFVC